MKCTLRALPILIVMALFLCACQPVMPVETTASAAQEEILVQGAPLRWPKGLGVDSHGKKVFCSCHDLLADCLYQAFVEGFEA